jgi:hypothetical protein
MPMGRTYSIAPELRRCCWYCIAASLFFSALLPFIPLEERPIEGLIGLLLFFGGVLLCCALALCWRLECTDTGLVRRGWLGRDAWTWIDFAGGGVRKGPLFRFVDPARPWWRRKLDIGLLGRDERREVMEAVNAHYRLPPAPPLPDSLTIRYRFIRAATFDAAGIRHTASGVTHVYDWDSVSHVMIERHDAVRRDFRTLDLWMHGTNPNWRGATAEELNEFVFRYLPADRIEVAIDGDYSASPRLVEKRLAALRKRERELRWLPSTGAALFAVGVFVLLAAEGISFTQAVMLGGLCLFMFTASYLIAKRELRREFQELESSRSVAHRA